MQVTYVVEWICDCCMVLHIQSSVTVCVKPWSCSNHTNRSGVDFIKVESIQIVMPSPVTITTASSVLKMQWKLQSHYMQLRWKQSMISAQDASSSMYMEITISWCLSILVSQIQSACVPSVLPWCSTMGSSACKHVIYGLGALTWSTEVHSLWVGGIHNPACNLMKLLKLCNKGPSCSFCCLNLSCFAAWVLFVFLYCFVRTPPSSACADAVHAGVVNSPSAELLHVHKSWNSYLGSSSLLLLLLSSVLQVEVLLLLFYSHCY